MEDDLEHIMNATSQQGLMDGFRAFGKSVAELSQLAAKRQAVSVAFLLPKLTQANLFFIDYICTYYFFAFFIYHLINNQINIFSINVKLFILFL